VTGVGKRAIAALAALVLAAFLVSCGGSDSNAASDSSTSANPAGNGGTAQQGAAKGAQSGGQAEHKGGSGGGEEGSAEAGSGKLSTPLKVSGGGSEQFRSKGGDNSIQEFGEESDEAELEEAAEALHGFYVARAEEDWGRACSYLADSMVGQLEQLASQSPQLKSKGCAAILRSFTRPLPAPVRRETTVVDAASLRSEGEQSFLIYRGEGGTVYAMPMKDEGGAWKVGLLAATPLG
jgi:hypothetical protein